MRRTAALVFLWGSSWVVVIAVVLGVRVLLRG